MLTVRGDTARANAEVNTSSQSLPAVIQHDVVFNGSFSQRIDFKVPEQRGLEPRPGLSYDSGRAAGYGSDSRVGAGWRLTGLSTIERANSRRAVPTFTSADIWLLDGQELVTCGTYVGAGCQPEAGGTHATWVEGFQRIKQITESNTWEVTARDGTRYVYKPLGTWAESGTVPLTGDDQNLMLNQYRYMLAEKIDTLGQKVSFDYTCGDDLDCWISMISYSIGEIRFHWEARPDVESYAAGLMLGKNAHRLRSVEVRAAGQMLRTYELIYGKSLVTGRSLLTSVTERGRDSVVGTDGVVTAGTALPPYTFQYTGDTPAPNRVADGQTFGGSAGEYLRAMAYASLSNNRHVQNVRINGKIVKKFETGDWVEYHYCVETRSDAGVVREFQVDYKQGVPCNIRNVKFYFLKNSHSLGRSYFYNYEKGKWHKNSDGDYWTWLPVVNSTYGSPDVVGDMDGDGLDDVIDLENGSVKKVVFSGGRTSWGNIRGNGFSAIDVNGDGLDDSYHRNQSTVEVRYSNGKTGFDGAAFSKALSPMYYDYIGLGDFNGDGVRDFLRALDNSGNYRIAYTVGQTFVDGPNVSLPGSCVNGTSCIAPSIADVNGDGRSDLIVRGGGTNNAKGKVYLNADSGFQLVNGTGGTSYTLDGAIGGVGDVDADGLPEMTLTKNGDSAQRWTIITEKPDLLKFAKTSLGAETTVAYAYHEPVTEKDLPLNLFVVKSLETYDGRSVRATTDYSYTGARYNWKERQFLGFEKITATLPKIDGETGRPVIETTYRQDLAAIGQISQILRKDGAGNVLQKRVVSYSIEGSTKPFRVFNTATVTTTYFDGIARTRSEQREFDAHGLVNATIQHGDTSKIGDEWRHTKWAYPNYADYIVDRWAVETINAGSLYHYTDARYWRRWHFFDNANDNVEQAPAKGLKTRTSEWTGGAAEDKTALVTTTHDIYGNVLNESDALGNRTDYFYDAAYHLFSEEVRNPLYPSDSRQKKTYIWDKVCGVVQTETDENGSVTSHSYDLNCRRVETNLPGGGRIDYQYIEWGNPDASYNRVSTLHPNGAGQIHSETQFDGFGRTIEERIASGTGGVDHAGQRVQQEFDARGNVKQRSHPSVTDEPSAWDRYQYDSLDRQVKVIHPDGSTVTSAYIAGDSFSAVETTDEGGHKQASHMDAFGNEVYRDRFDGTNRMRTTYRYDVLGRLVEITDPLGSKWFYAYDGHGNKLAARDPDLGCRQMVYDKAKRLTAQYSAAGGSVSYLYDELGRVVHKATDKNALQFADCTAVNDTPQANNDYGFATTSVQPLTIAASVLLANDTDPNNDIPAVFSVQEALNGTVELSSDKQTITFIPDSAFVGVTTFGYTIWDGELKSSATVEITVATPPSSAGSQTFTASGNFTVPYYKDLTVVVAGGGGGSGQNSSWYGNQDMGEWRRGANGGSGGTSRFLGVAGGGGGGGAGGYADCNGQVCRASSGANAGASGGNVSNATGGGGSGGSGPATSQRGAQLGGHGGRGGKATSKWTLGQSGAPTVAEVIPVTVGGGGGGYRNGGGGAVTITWTAYTTPTAGPDRVETNAETPVTFAVLGNDSDPNGDALSVTMIDNSAVSSGAMVAAAGGTVMLNADNTLTYTPAIGVSGTQSFTYMVSDGSETASATVTVVLKTNNAPYVAHPIPDQSIEEDSSWSYTLPANVFADADGQALTIAATSPGGGSLPAWMSYDVSTQTFSATPPLDYNGIVPITVSASDGQATDSNSFNLNIVAVNDAPVLAHPIDNQSVLEEAAWAYSIPAETFTDVDNDTLSFVAELQNNSALPVWLEFDNESGRFSGTPPTGSQGTLGLRVHASDGAETAEAEFDLTIKTNNNEPVLTAPIADQSVEEDSAWAFTVPAGAFTDPDGDVLTYAATLADGSTLPDWVTIAETTGVFSGTPPADLNGTLEIVVIASDGLEQASDTFQLTILPVNDAPRIAVSIPDQSVNEDDTWTYSFPADSFLDLEGDEIVYSATLSNSEPLPSWLTFTSSTRTFSGTPPANFHGDVDLMVTASDGALSSSDVFRLTVTAINDAPSVYAAIPDTMAIQGAAWSYSFPSDTFKDIDDGTLTYTARLASGADLPAWLTFDSATRTFSGTLPNDDSSAVDLLVVASDGEANVEDRFELHSQAEEIQVLQRWGIRAYLTRGILTIVSDTTSQTHDRRRNQNPYHITVKGGNARITRFDYYDGKICSFQYIDLNQTRTKTVSPDGSASYTPWVNGTEVLRGNYSCG